MSDPAIIEVRRLYADLADVFGIEQRPDESLEVFVERVIEELRIDDGATA